MDIKSNYTPAQARETGFDRNAYTPAAEGVFTGTLVMKVYGDFCLRCYFETDDGQTLAVFFTLPAVGSPSTWVMSVSSHISSQPSAVQV